MRVILLPFIQIMVKDCVEVLKDSVEQEHKFDYVINDLTEFSVAKDKYGIISTLVFISYS